MACEEFDRSKLARFSAIIANIYQAVAFLFSDLLFELLLPQADGLFILGFEEMMGPYFAYLIAVADRHSS